MAFMLLFDAVAHEKIWSPIEIDLLNKWLGIITSILLLFGVIFIRKIFNFLDRIERLRKENESRVLNAIIRTEEKERKQFAKDMHDGLGPLLSSVKMSLSAISDESMTASDKRILENTKTMMDEAIHSLKEISNHLSPHILTNFGLVRALQNYAGKLNSLHSIQIDIDGQIGNQRFNYNIEVVIYRVITELINNTLKHAEANQIAISVSATEQILTVVYRDNGKGFEPDKTLNQLQSGMGYDNINTRLKSIMAQMTLQSNLGEGVYVKIEVPVF
jgi:signal transduction histidine kinase